MNLHFYPPQKKHHTSDRIKHKVKLRNERETFLKRKKKEKERVLCLRVPTEQQTWVTKQHPLLYGLLMRAVPSFCLEMSNILGQSSSIGLSKDMMPIGPILNEKLSGDIVI
jgi:hypothetical protein